MTLSAPSAMPQLALTDVYDQTISLPTGRKLMLSLFREATCPFCNYRVYELTHNYREMNAQGMDIVAIFSSNREDVMKFIARQPRPFRMVADPEGTIHQAYGTQTSMWGKMVAMLRRMGAFFYGMRQVGMQGMRTGNILPADFLIDENGRIVDIYYGRDAGDHIPMARVQAFLRGEIS